MINKSTIQLLNSKYVYILINYTAQPNYLLSYLFLFIKLFKIFCNELNHTHFIIFKCIKLINKGIFIYFSVGPKWQEARNDLNFWQCINTSKKSKTHQMYLIYTNCISIKTQAKHIKQAEKFHQCINIQKQLNQHTKIQVETRVECYNRSRTLKNMPNVDTLY